MLTILLVTYNRRDFLERCLSCLYETTSWLESDNCQKLIIWDNGSEDDTVNFLKAFEKFSNKDNVQIVYNKENIGTEAFIKMMDYVRTPTVMTLTDDAWISTEGWADVIPDCLVTDPSFGAIMLWPICDERQAFGVPWGGKENSRLSRPRFMTETIVGTYRGRAYPTEAELQKNLAVEMLPNHWVVKGPNPELLLPLTDFCTVWRTEFIKNAGFKPVCGLITDVGDECRVQLAAQGRSYGISIEFTAYHAAGPWWHLGRYKGLWLEKCAGSARSTYGISKEEMLNWYKQAEAWSGWATGDLSRE